MIEDVAPCSAADCNGTSDVFCSECGAPVCGACSQREAIGCCIVSGKPDDRKEWKRRADAAEALLNAPEIVDFVRAVQLEAAHQRARWGSDHDAGKTDADWFWLLGYLGGKALRADDGIEKQLHRIITVAAAACNWHAAKLGQTNMRPGIETPNGLGTDGFDMSVWKNNGKEPVFK